MSDPTRAYLHVGLHKTGTTYLQNLLRANREQLLAQGVEYLADQDVAQRIATKDLKKSSRRGYNDPRIPGAWDRLVAGIESRGAPVVLISDEGLGGALRRQVARAVKSFGAREVHVIATVRDIGRVLVSQWQEQVKNDNTWTWDEYVDAVRDPARAGSDPARGFWWRQDIAALLGRWEQVLPPDRIHVVTVPPRGAPPTVLLERFGSVVGFDPEALPNQPKWDNESVGVAGTEVIRRLNVRLGGRLSEPAYSRAVKARLAPALARRPDVARFTLPLEHVEWAMSHADTTIATLEKRGYAVAGDLEDLRVAPEAGGRRPDEFSTDELLEASLDGLAAIVEEYARSWWVRKKVSIDDRWRPSRVQLAARGVRDKARRQTLAVANKSPVVGRLVARALRQQPRKSG